MDRDATIDDVKSLHTAAIDACNGYEEALQDAEGHGMSPLFREMIALHTQNADELATALSRAGAPVDDSASFMSTVHRTVISIRSLFGGLGQSVLPGLIDGESRNVSHYDRALAATTVTPATRSLLTTQRNRLTAAITKMQAEKVA